MTDLEQVPDGAADLVFVCTPSKANLALLEQAAAKGVRAAFVASGGYGEAGDEGRRAQQRRPAQARSLTGAAAGRQCGAEMMNAAARLRVGLVALVARQAQTRQASSSHAASAGSRWRLATNDFQTPTKPVTMLDIV